MPPQTGLHQYGEGCYAGSASTCCARALAWAWSVPLKLMLSLVVTVTRPEMRLGESVVAITEQAVVDLCRTGGQNDVATVTGIQLQLALVVHCGGNVHLIANGDAIGGLYRE